MEIEEDSDLLLVNGFVKILLSATGVFIILAVLLFSIEDVYRLFGGS